MRDTVGEAKTNSLETFPNRPLHMDVPMLADQQEFIYNNSVWKQGIVIQDLPEAMDDRDEWREKGNQEN